MCTNLCILLLLLLDHPLKSKEVGIMDSGCSRSMSGNKEKMHDFVPIEGGGIVTFGGGDGRITGKGTIRTPLLDLRMCTMSRNCNTLTCSLYHKSVTKRTKYSFLRMNVLYSRKTSFFLRILRFS